MIETYVAELGKRRSAPRYLGEEEGAAMRKFELLMITVLVIAGLYFLVFHRAPFPLNHESVGLGNLHSVHDILGIALIGVAGIIGWRSMRLARAKTPD